MIRRFWYRFWRAYHSLAADVLASQITMAQARILHHRRRQSVQGLRAIAAERHTARRVPRGTNHADAADARPRVAAAGAGDGVGLETASGQD